jgi:fatty acid/phospholipid biosynthesis enzyme
MRWGLIFAPERNISAIETVKRARAGFFSRGQSGIGRSYRVFFSEGPIEILDANEVITMEDEPVAALRSKRQFVHCQKDSTR